MVVLYSKDEKTMDLLFDAAERISENVLDFEMKYAGSDEMGMLIGAMDTMWGRMCRNLHTGKK